MISKIPTNVLREEFRNLELDIKNKINSFYVVKRGNREFTGTHFLWENGELKEIWYKRSKKSRKSVEEPTEEDLRLVSSFSYKEIPYFYPENHFFHNSRINTNRENHIYDLFTPRNLMALSLLMDRIEKIENKMKGTAGSSYERIAFQGSEKSIHKVLTLYWADTRHPMGRRGVEIAFEMKKGDIFLGWLIFQMDMDRLKKEFDVTEEMLKMFQFEEHREL